MASWGTKHGETYHDLLGLHHSMLLRRRMRGVGPDATDWRERVETLLAAWPQRLADQEVLRASLPMVEPLADTVGYLYTALFRDNPALRGLFPESLHAQQERFAWSLKRLMVDLDRPEVIVPLFAELGRAHRKLGVRTVHYGPFGSAFLEALRLRAGAAWRAEYEAAWLRAYDFVAEVMSAAAENDLGEPPYVKATVVHHELRRPDLAVLHVQPAEPYPYRAGQYATVESPRLPHSWRSYSIANAPTEQGTVELHVRATGTGRLSDVLVHHTRVGDELRLGPARGTVTLTPVFGAGVLLAAGGTGLATAKALLGELARLRDLCIDIRELQRRKLLAGADGLTGLDVDARDHAADEERQPQLVARRDDAVRLDGGACRSCNGGLHTHRRGTRSDLGGLPSAGSEEQHRTDEGNVELQARHVTVLPWQDLPDRGAAGLPPLRNRAPPAARAARSG